MRWIALLSLTAALTAAGDECGTVQTLRTGEVPAHAVTAGSAAVAVRAPAADQAEGVDIAATRAYLRTDANGFGSEVDQPALGQKVYIYGDYTVSGGSGPVNVTRRLLLDGAPYCDSGSYQSPGSYTVYCLAPWVATAGTHTLQWVWDHTGSVAETNESNNSASKSVTPTGVDIVAQRAFLRTAPSNGGSEVAVPEVGQTVYFHVAFKVESSASSPVTVAMRLNRDGQIHCSCETVATPGNTYVASCLEGYTVTQTTHTIQWDLDLPNAVPETNEGNNSVNVSFTPTGGDLTPPAGSAILNGGEPFTSTRRVRLTMSATDAESGVAGTWISTSPATPAAGQSGWVSTPPVPSYDTTIGILLPAGEGVKTVYVWYKDAMENVSARYSDSIVLGPAVRNDVNGDGRADLLWRNTFTEQTSIWFMNGATAGSTWLGPDVPPGWRPAVWSDLEGDGLTDFYWHNGSTGRTGIWLRWNGSGFELMVHTETAQPVPPEWAPAGGGKLDGDEKADLFWYNGTTGETSIWFMNGTTYLSAIRSTTVPPAWTPSLTGDFDADGRLDVFWRNPSTGETSLWMGWNGTSFAVQVRSLTVPTAWVPVGAGDVTGDGRSDIFWHNPSTGETSLWVMNGAATPAVVALTTVPAGWSPVAFGDYDRDARTDVFWHNPSTGETSVWLGFNGTAFTTQVRGDTVPPAWVPFRM